MSEQQRRTLHVYWADGPRNASYTPTYSILCGIEDGLEVCGVGVREFVIYGGTGYLTHFIPCAKCAEAHPMALLAWTEV